MDSDHDARVAGDVVVPRSWLERLCRAALRAGIAADDAELGLALIGRLRGDARPPMAPHVEVYTLGRFALLVNGCVPAVAHHRRSPHKPLELLQALIALGGREVRVEALVSAVWPTDESADPRNLFDNTLHRLRRLLNVDDAIELHDGKLTLEAVHCWVDAWAFEQLSSEVLSAVDGASDSLIGRVLELYVGPFLGCEAPRRWMQAYRDRLHARFVRVVMAQAERLDAAGRWREAMACCERALEIDPGAHGIHAWLEAARMRHPYIAP
jgi:LuxR family maltose regulon positive regulatory protein